VSSASPTEPRTALCEAMRALVADGLTRGTAGNLSVRAPNGMLLTPSGVRPDALDAESIVAVAADGTVLERGRRPSSEWRFHRDIYAVRAEVRAVVHVHSPYATALACQRRGIPPFHYMIAVAGGDSVRCAEYATFGTHALSDAALAALAGRRACLLANHGQIALGASLAAALALAGEVEELARQFLLAGGGGVPVLLDSAEMHAVLRQFEGYGTDHGESEAQT
jgi:L-fuculose-phosphate aldolase